MNEDFLLKISYLIASVLFIGGLKMLSHPSTARRGNLLAATGMALAIFGTIAFHEDKNGAPIGNYVWIFSGMLMGIVIGWMSAKKIQMIAMPQMVSIFNGMGGACAAMIALIEFPHFLNDPENSLILFTIFGGLAIGSISFSGSIVAFAKLNGNLNKDIRIPFYNVINYVVLLGIMVIAALILLYNIENATLWIYVMFVAALIYGILFVIPIGGADMPVVISLLDAFTGIAAALMGMVYQNMVMVLGGILVGSSGTILTILMCKAMNRSLFNVIVGGFGSTSLTSVTAMGELVRETTASDAAILMGYAENVMVIPGYGMAVAQAQKVCKDLDNSLTERGVNLNYAVHPVAGRMPGHMNVLLAEADVPYSKLIDLDDANNMLKDTDVCLVVGANDVVNPSALDDPSSPIYGMPVLEILKSEHVVVLKRGMNKGYSGIENPLFFNNKTQMLFGDAKSTIEDLNEKIKALD